MYPIKASTANPRIWLQPNPDDLEKELAPCGGALELRL